MLLLLWACAGTDADHDGATADVDCDDDNPFVYPGAPDDPGDGLDADCADGDPPYPWLGDWSATDLTASTFGIDLFVPGTGTAELSIGDDLSVTLEIGGELNPDIIGSSVEIEVLLAGEVSPVEGPDTLVVYAEGDNYDEAMHVDWACELDEDVLYCDGGFKALEASLGTTATFARD